MTPKQAAMLMDLLSHGGGTINQITSAICLHQEWEIFPWIYVNGPEEQENLDQMSGFLDELSKQFREYAQNCPKKPKQPAKPVREKKPDKTQLSLGAAVGEGENTQPR